MKMFYERIYEIRKENGLTQEQVADELNVSRQTISNWETGSAQPTIDKVIELSKLYEISVDDMINNKININKEKSSVLLSMLNQVGTLYLDYNSKAVAEMFNTEFKNCKLIEVTPLSIRVLITIKKQETEKLFFIDEINTFIVEVN